MGNTFGRTCHFGGAFVLILWDFLLVVVEDRP